MIALPVQDMWLIRMKRPMKNYVILQSYGWKSGIAITLWQTKRFPVWAASRKTGADTTLSNAARTEESEHVLPATLTHATTWKIALLSQSLSSQNVERSARRRNTSSWRKRSLKKKRILANKWINEPRFTFAFFRVRMKANDAKEGGNHDRKCKCWVQRAGQRQQGTSF